jgi:hypothetical protein
MPLPPPGDPVRPVYLAARSLRLLGVLFLLIGLLSLLPWVKPALHQVRPLPPAPPGTFVTAVSHALPGALYLVCAAALLRGTRAGVFAAMGLAMAHFILVVGNLARFVQLLVTREASPGFLFIALTIGFLTVAALAQLMYHLVKSLRVLRAPTADLESPPLDQPTAGADRRPGRL